MAHCCVSNTNYQSVIMYRDGTSGQQLKRQLVLKCASAVFVNLKILEVNGTKHTLTHHVTDIYEATTEITNYNSHWVNSYC